MRLDRAASIDDLRDMARRRIPQFAFDLVDGGAESERNMRRNSELPLQMEKNRKTSDIPDILYFDTA